MSQKVLAKLYAGEENGGMEMIQVAFSIAVAVMLGSIIVLFNQNTVVPGIEGVDESAGEVFGDLKDMIRAYGSAS